MTEPTPARSCIITLFPRDIKVDYLTKLQNLIRDTVDDNGKPVYRYEITKYRWEQDEKKRLYISYLFKRDVKVCGPLYSQWNDDDTEPLQCMAHMFLTRFFDIHN